MGLDNPLTNGQTPLDDEERVGLLIPGVNTREELDEFEQLNIERAIKWSLKRRLSSERILTEDFLKLAHKKMYGEVWSWAGKFRRSNKNIGVDWTEVQIQVRQLLQDCGCWIDNLTYGPDEIAVRFKHRLVSIHCFPNGNGRHSRFMADLIITNIFGLEPFSWGVGIELLRPGVQRSAYLRVLKAADEGKITPLLEFART